MAFGVPGFRIGHVTSNKALTGCTVILCPPKTVGGCDIRGTSPATRETALLGSEKSMQEVHVVLLTGGSAFGLAAADGVMKYLEEQNIGYQTPWIKVPIVPAAAIFDLNIGDKNFRPTGSDGYEACVNAADRNDKQGNYGAGTGATVGKWAGSEFRMKGGLGISTILNGELIVGCIAVVNAVGDVINAGGRILAGARNAKEEFFGEKDPLRTFARPKEALNSNTTLIVVAANAHLSKVQTNRLAQRAHDGMARSIIPVHTSYDGDIAFGLSCGAVDANFDLVAEMGAEATAQAIRNAVTKAASAGGVVGLAG
jgi:L-aminopeptidase/D-esterase-like protein